MLWQQQTCTKPSAVKTTHTPSVSKMRSQSSVWPKFNRMVKEPVLRVGMQNARGLSGGSFEAKIITTIRVFNTHRSQGLLAAGSRWPQQEVHACLWYSNVGHVHNQGVNLKCNHRLDPFQYTVYTGSLSLLCCSLCTLRAQSTRRINPVVPLTCRIYKNSVQWPWVLYSYG